MAATVNITPRPMAVLTAETEHLEYEADGSCCSQDEVYLTILDEEGKSKHEVLSFHVNQAYARLTIEFCEIIRSGQSISIETATQSREEAAAGNSRANIYNPPGRKVVKLFIPDLRIGDTIHYPAPPPPVQTHHQPRDLRRGSRPSTTSR